MSRRLLAGFGVVALTSSSLAAQTLSIDHQPVACAVAEKFPRLEARFAPADTVATARVLFQPENAQQWYAVAMKSEGPGFSGVLPKPKKSLKAYRYYIEVTDKALGTNRTADYTTNVVDSSSACKGKIVAAALGSASVLLQVPAGAAALPAGFASTGVVATASGSAAAAAGATAAGGGGHAVAIALGVVGAGAVAGGVAALAAKGGDEIMINGYVYVGACNCPASRPPPYPFPTGGPIQNAVASTTLNSTTATSDAEGHFVLVIPKSSDSETDSARDRSARGSVTAPGCSSSSWEINTHASRTIYFSLVCSNGLPPAPNCSCTGL